MTEIEDLRYIEGTPIKCANCGNNLAIKAPGSTFKVCTQKEGTLFVKCKRCRKITAIKG